MILSDKADLLHVEKVHLALRGREEKKKKKIDIQKSQQHLFKKKKNEAKNDQKTDFLRAVHNLHRKKVFTGVFFSLISLLRERYKNWDRSAENDPITAK